MKCDKLNKKQRKELQAIINDNNCSSKEIKRAQAIVMVDNEIEINQISQITGYRRSQIFVLRNKYLEKGISAIEDPARKNPKELLSKKQRDEITEIVKDKTPDDVGFHGTYWTTALLGEYIKRKYKIKYKSRTSLYLFFQKASFSYHKPGRIYHLRNEEEVQKWQKMAKPILEKAFKDKNTVILAEDEMILSTQTTFQKIWLPKNEYPKIEVSNKKENRSVYGFLNIKTGEEHAFKTKWQNMYITRNILKKIRKIYPSQKILLFWDGAGWHRGSATQEFIKKDKNIETIYFPRYSPEENPEEHVWRSGRSKVTHNKYIENIDKTTNKFISYLRKTKFNYSLLGFSPILE